MTDSGSGYAELFTPAEGVGNNSEVKAKRGQAFKRLLRKYAPVVLVSLVYAVLCFMLFANAKSAGQAVASLSLRYDVPLSAQQVAQGKRMLENPDLVVNFTPAFWHNSADVQLQSLSGEAVPALFVDGDMQFVYSAEFLYGGYPSALESRGVAITEELAWKLFNTVEAVGQTLELRGEEYTVRGVFAGDANMLLVQVKAADTTVESFEGVELAGAVQGEAVQAGKDIATAMGLPTPTHVISAKTLPGIISALAFLPLAVLVIWFIVKLYLLLRRGNFWFRQIFWFGILFIAVVLLPRALALLPGWMIPTQWSNLEHWSEVFKELTARLTAWLSMKPSLADVALTLKLVWQVVLLLPALLALFAAIRRLNGFISSGVSHVAPSQCSL